MNQIQKLLVFITILIHAYIGLISLDIFTQYSDYLISRSSVSKADIRISCSSLPSFQSIKAITDNYLFQKKSISFHTVAKLNFSNIVKYFENVNCFLIDNHFRLSSKSLTTLFNKGSPFISLV